MKDSANHVSVLILVGAAVLLQMGCGTQQTDSGETAHWSVPTEWIFEDPGLWTFDGETLELALPGAIPADLRRPGAVATAAGSDGLGDFHLRARVKSTQDTTIVGRDVIIVFGYRSPSEFYYAHLSKDNTALVHNGIFIVDKADRRRIDDQGLENAPEARLTDTAWHRVRVDRDAESGSIRVFMDDLREPLMTATDTTFRSGAIGFGSFDDTGAIRDFRYVEGPAPLLDPLPDHPQDAELAVELVPFATIPSSDTSGGPMARINFLDHANDGTGRLFVNDMRGALYAIENGTVRSYLDVAGSFPNFVDEPGLGTGFGFFAFHPDFGSNGKLYTVHTEAGAALRDRQPDYSSGGQEIIQGVIVEWTATDPAAPVFSGSPREVIRLGFGATFHGIQQFGFNPLAKPGDEDHGLLYVAVGDGELPGAQTPLPQMLSSHAAKILRIDPTGTDSPNGQYGIPPTNPFLETPGALGEVWALGLRNPHRFSWDAESGAMYIGHMGEAQVESVFPGKAGANYGWNVREGGFRFEKEDPFVVYPVPSTDHESEFTQPVVRLDHDDISALVGGFVYRGRRLPGLHGKYLFANLSNGNLFVSAAEDMEQGRPDTPIRRLGIVDVDGVRRPMAYFSGRTRTETRFGMDADGELYLLSKANGSIWRIAGTTAISKH